MEIIYPKLKKAFRIKTKPFTVKEKMMWSLFFGIMKPILSFTRKSVRGINKDKRELGLVLMALNIIKVITQRAEKNKKIIKKTISILFQ